MKRCYVVGGWTTRMGDDGMPEVVQNLYLDYAMKGRKFIAKDITQQVGPEIAHGDLCVYLVEAEQDVIDELASDPLYRIIPIEGKPSKKELDDLKGSEKLKDQIQKAETLHGANMSNEHLKDALCEAFRKQGRKVEV
jgi:hypothetical protein